MEDYPWYSVIDPDFSVSQGDILLHCPVPKIEENAEFPFFEGNATFIDGIVLTQACDLENGRAKVDNITLCRIVQLKELVQKLMEEQYKNTPSFDYSDLKGKQKDTKRKIIESLRKGEFLDFYLLNKFNSEDFPELNQDYRVVQLRKFYYVPVNSINRIAKQQTTNRLRLLPPYREHLSYSYAFNFSRIGLPVDIVIDPDEV